MVVVPDRSVSQLLLHLLLNSKQSLACAAIALVITILMLTSGFHLAILGRFKELI